MPKVSTIFLDISKIILFPAGKRIRKRNENCGISTNKHLNPHKIDICTPSCCGKYTKICHKITHGWFGTPFETIFFPVGDKIENYLTFESLETIGLLLPAPCWDVCTMYTVHGINITHKWFLGLTDTCGHTFHAKAYTLKKKQQCLTFEIWMTTATGETKWLYKKYGGVEAQTPINTIYNFIAINFYTLLFPTVHSQIYWTSSFIIFLRHGWKFI